MQVVWRAAPTKSHQRGSQIVWRAAPTKFYHRSSQAVWGAAPTKSHQMGSQAGCLHRLGKSRGDQLEPSVPQLRIFINVFIERIKFIHQLKWSQSTIIMVCTYCGICENSCNFVYAMNRWPISGLVFLTHWEAENCGAVWVDHINKVGVWTV